MSKHDEIMTRLAAIEERLSRIEAGLENLSDAARLREQLEVKREELDALARQSLHVVELLDAARREIAERGRDGGA